jgi:hypothetical protein
MYNHDPFNDDLFIDLYKVCYDDMIEPCIKWDGDILNIFEDNESIEEDNINIDNSEDNFKEVNNYKCNRIRKNYISENNMDTQIPLIANKLLHDKLLFFSTYEYIINIIKFYPNKNRIIRQFKLDCPRTNIRVNGKKINDYDQINKKLSFLKNIKLYNCKYISNLYWILIIICNQSSFCFPYMIINNLYGDEVNNNYPFSLSSKRDVDIDINSNKKSLTLECDFVIKNTTRNEDLFNLNTVLYFKLSFDKDINKRKSITDIISEEGLFIWKIF